MREKIILQDFNVLLVCTSTKWSTIERRVIFDSTFLRNMGCNPVILCHEGSQIDVAAEEEDISRLYIKKSRFYFFTRLELFADLKKLIKKNHYDIIHSYSLTATWSIAFILRANQKTPFFFTLNQSTNSIYKNVFAKLLLRRLDYIFTLSEELREFVEETFPVHKRKIKNLGSGLEIVKKPKTDRDFTNIGCVINNIAELKRLKQIVKAFRVLKSRSDNKYTHLQLYIFLGPRIYQKDHAKIILTEFDYEFYEGDILLYSLEQKSQLLKELDIFIGTAFDEPLNDYELAAIMNEIPVLFPRTAMRQSLLFKYSWVGESYYEGDIREAKTKLLKILDNYKKYQSALSGLSDELSRIHGLDMYAKELQKYYELAFAKRHKRLQQTNGKGSRHK